MRNLRYFSKKSRKFLDGPLTRAFAAALCLLGASCSSSGGTAGSATLAEGDYPTGVRLVIGHPPAPTTDTIEVFVCDVPVPTSDPLYGDRALRLQLDPTVIAEQMERGVRPYFEALSQGLYHAHFTAGSTIAMTVDETHGQCVDRALDASSNQATAVLAVATAEDLSTEPGGWGRPGTLCPSVMCAARSTRRAAYVGASDFHPDNGDEPLLDLIEHELGHTLDLPHSGGAAEQYDSALDVMSNSAAPRVTQPGRKDAQDTLGVNRLALGWLPRSAIAVAPAGGTFDLLPSNGADDEPGTRLLILPVDDLSFVTVEYLAADGLDDFLPTAGLAVHLIDQSAAVCAHPDTSAADSPCIGIDRRQLTLGNDAPHLDLLHADGATWTLEGWAITVVGQASTGVQVEVHLTHG